VLHLPHYVEDDCVASGRGGEDGVVAGERAAEKSDMQLQSELAKLVVLLQHQGSRGNGAEDGIPRMTKEGRCKTIHKLQKMLQEAARRLLDRDVEKEYVRRLAVRGRETKEAEGTTRGTTKRKLDTAFEGRERGQIDERVNQQGKRRICQDATQGKGKQKERVREKRRVREQEGGEQGHEHGERDGEREERGESKGMAKENLCKGKEVAGSRVNTPRRVKSESVDKEGEKQAATTHTGGVDSRNASAAVLAKRHSSSHGSECERAQATERAFVASSSKNRAGNCSTLHDAVTRHVADAERVRGCGWGVGKGIGGGVGGCVGGEGMEGVGDGRGRAGEGGAGDAREGKVRKYVMTKEVWGAVGNALTVLKLLLASVAQERAVCGIDIYIYMYFYRCMYTYMYLYLHTYMY